DAHSVWYRGRRLLPGSLLGQVRLLAGVRPARAARFCGPLHRAMDIERARRQERRAVRVLDLLDGRRADDARLWLREARARDHLRPRPRNADLHAQHHADLPRAQGDGEGVSWRQLFHVAVCESSESFRPTTRTVVYAQYFDSAVYDPIGHEEGRLGD